MGVHFGQAWDEVFVFGVDHERVFAVFYIRTQRRDGAVPDDYRLIGKDLFFVHGHYIHVPDHDLPLVRIDKLLGLDDEGESTKEKGEECFHDGGRFVCEVTICGAGKKWERDGWKWDG